MESILSDLLCSHSVEMDTISGQLWAEKIHLWVVILNRIVRVEDLNHQWVLKLFALAKSNQSLKNNLKHYWNQRGFCTLKIQNHLPTPLQSQLCRTKSRWSPVQHFPHFHCKLCVVVETTRTRQELGKKCFKSRSLFSRWTGEEFQIFCSTESSRQYF